MGVPVIEAYGMTEAAHQTATNPLPPRQRKPGSVGLAAGWVWLRATLSSFVAGLGLSFPISTTNSRISSGSPRRPSSVNRVNWSSCSRRMTASWSKS